MQLARIAKPTLALPCAALAALALSACGGAVSTAAFKGGEREVAQAIANLQADATAGDEKKLCANDASASVVASLGGRKRCERSIKRQLTEVDSLEVSVKSIQMGSAGKTAVALVKSTYSGKTRMTTVLLVKEGATWKVSGLQ